MSSEGAWTFLVALPRSGSTWLAYVLDCHSRVHVLHEESARPFGGSATARLRSLEWKIGTGFERYLGSLLPAGKDQLLVTRYFLRREIQLIDAALGRGARFLVLTRRRHWRVFYTADGQPRAVPLRSIYEFAASRRYLRARLPSRSLEVAYEDLLAAPAAKFAEICRFMGLDFEPRMLDYWAFDHPHLARTGNEKTRRMPDRERGERPEPPWYRMVLDAIVVRATARATRLGRSTG